jgi:hypothetical protein
LPASSHPTGGADQSASGSGANNVLTSQGNTGSQNPGHSGSKRKHDDDHDESDESEQSGRKNPKGPPYMNDPDDDGAPVEKMPCTVDGCNVEFPYMSWLM